MNTLSVHFLGYKTSLLKLDRKEPYMVDSPMAEKNRCFNESSVQVAVQVAKIKGALWSKNPGLGFTEIVKSLEIVEFSQA